jgi:4-hydroxybenzoate polyprenyltransferase
LNAPTPASDIPPVVQAAFGANVLPDARPTSLILRLTPPAALPFVQLARLDRPIGWQLLLAPCWQSAALAGLARGTGPDFVHLALFMIGAIAMRGAGSTYNDILDRKLDAGVARTKGRPLPSGRIGVRAAVVFMVFEALAGLAVLLCFNRFSIVLGLGSLGIVAVYPLMKRITAWPQAVLGLAFSWGALMGWAAIYGGLALPALFLYASAFCWTIGYDTIYALQDARDDAIVGIKSTARLFGARVRSGVGVFYLGAGLFALLAIATAGGGIVALAGLCAYCLHLAWQLRRVEGATARTALALFHSNLYAGLILFAGIALQGWLARLPF